MSSEQPHVFVIHGDLAALACDAVLVPTDARLSVRAHWHGIVPEHARLADLPELEAFRREAVLAHVLDPSRNDPDGPLRVLTAVPLNGFTAVDELHPRIGAFIDAAITRIPGHRESRLGSGQLRALPLVAMPLFASGGGGGGWRRTTIIDATLASAREFALRHGVDVALVLPKEPDAALAQQRRRQAGSISWTALEPRLVDVARQLARHALADRMVPFMGAGVSMSAGAPNWSSLLEELAQRAGLDADTREALFDGTIGPLDQASFLQRQFADGNFRSAVAELVERDRYGLAPALLASIADEQAITLNYDTLFERASDAAGRPRRVISGADAAGAAVEPVGSPDRWLLKLHGSSTHPDSIVLTRDDYLGFAADRSALSAIVKANLLTRHLLFVGFGLADDHFHEIMHDVKRAVGRTPTSATAVTLFDDPLSDGLWGDSLTVVPMLAERSTEDAFPRAARTLELFLDVLAAHSVDSESYLREPEYEEGLTESELRVRALLLALEAEAGQHYMPRPVADTP